MGELADSVAEMATAELAWNGALYPCAAGVQRTQREPTEEGGFEVLTFQTLIAARTSFGVLTPSPAEAINYRGLTYTIAEVITPAEGDVITFKLIASR